MMLNIFFPLVLFQLNNLESPVLFSLSLALKRTDQVDVIRDLIIEKLPTQNYNVLKYLIEFLNLVRRINLTLREEQHSTSSPLGC